MSFFHSVMLAGASGNQGTYEIEQSLRTGSDNQNLQRTLSASGNRRTWTWSGWIKRSEISAEQHFLESWNGSGDVLIYARFNSNDKIRVKQFDGSTNLELDTDAVFRDPSAWYHIVIAFDTTQATASDRAKIYVNGELQSLSTATYPSQNYETFMNRSGYRFGLMGALWSSFYTRSFNGYMAEAHLIDGTALDPTSFGKTNTDGVWVPVEYMGSHGTEGCYIKFDETATNGIGHDHSGNGNNLTNNNFTTSGAGTDLMSDTPTKNFPTLNPLDNLNGRYSNDPTNGNLEVSIPSDSVSKRNFPGFYSTQAIPTTGKFYFEFEPSQQYTTINIVDVDEVGTISSGDHVGQSDKLSFQYFCESGNYRFNGTSTASGLGGFSSGNIYGVAVDLENETFRVYENGVAGSELSISGYLGADSRIAPSVDASGSSGTVTMNFGQREFLYPIGTYTASAYFNTVLWTGDNNDDRSITVGFQPDLVWYKRRNLSASYLLFDSVRGATKALSSNNETTENTEANALQAFETNGFQVGDDANSNSSSYNYVAWCWKAGGTASSNTDGSITASVSASDAAGFSVVKFEGNNTAGATVGHGLSTAPSFIITKNIDNSSAYWATFHASAGKSQKFYINDNQAPDAATNWLDVSDSTITWNQTDVNNVNTNNNTFICYCWAEKTGVSKFGSYIGNGSTDGPLISDLGFAPALVVIKRSIGGNSEWAVYDSARGDNTQLRWDAPDQDNTNSAVNVRLTNNGFKIETSDAAQNKSGDTYLYMAWARASSADADYKALNTANLPAPEIKDGSKYFEATTYSGATSGTAGAGTTQAVTGLSFSPDFVWIKNRTNGNSHGLFDIVRGAVNALRTDTNGLEATTNSSGALSAFDSNGFTLANGSSGSDQAILTHQTGSNYVAWAWDAGGSVSADNNTNGSITSTVSVNATAGFSIVTYTGTGTAGTVGHGLGVKPSFYVVKPRSYSNNWPCWHKDLTSDGYYIHLNFALKQDLATAVWNGTGPSSTVFNIGTNTNVNQLDATFVAYVFAEVEGYSKISSYPGNGVIDGPFVYCGFRPAFVLIKNYRGGSETNWIMRDSARSPYNKVHPSIYANTAAAEINNFDMDFLANGFKIKDDNAVFNESGSDYLFLAFAENPFGGSGISPATAR